MATSLFFNRSAWVWMTAILVSVGASATTIEFSIPGPPFVQYQYFHELLKEPLEANGHQVNVGAD